MLSQKTPVHKRDSEFVFVRDLRKKVAAQWLLTHVAERKLELYRPVFMKKYLVFTYYVGRSLGGVKDFLDVFETVEEALDNILVERNRYYQIVDRDSMKVVREGLSMFKNFVPEKFSAESSTED